MLRGYHCFCFGSSLSPTFQLHLGSLRFAVCVRQAPRNGLSLVCFRRAGWTDEENHALLERINDSGRMFFVHTKLEGAEVLRFCVGWVCFLFSLSEGARSY